VQEADDKCKGRPVRIISKKTLREFWSKHPKSEDSLIAWHRVVERLEWSGPNDVRNTYRTADTVGDEFVVFNICKNDYRLVVRVDYARSIVYIFGVYTHAQYDRLDLKEIDDEINRQRKKKRESEQSD
jgi:mRNA interferase HigB